MGMLLPVLGEGWCRMEMGDDGAPHGVSTLSVAASVKPGSDWIPVPPITAMRTGASYVEATPAMAISLEGRGIWDEERASGNLNEQIGTGKSNVKASMS